MRSRGLWILLLIIGIGLLALILRHDQGTIGGLETGDFASLVYKIALLIFIGGAVLALFRERIAEAFQAAMFWVVIGLLLAIGYTYRNDLRDVADRVLTELLPGRALSRGGTVEIARGNRGEFQIIAEINGARISTVYDTGASAVVLTQEAAKAAGLPLDFLNYSVQVETANGRARAAPVTLDRIRVGGIEERQVSALIAQPGQLRTSLLGMSFLNRLKSSEVHGDRLVLRGN
ncbi:MAG TPA: TIGR02281 family clan AA aspartic protease [Burkholderiales bacterium]|jgi:aspartyl protease family protein|nr:TIGR02281 family clan AA aspartic protease [Burkholderiales bacterium]